MELILWLGPIVIVIVFGVHHHKKRKKHRDARLQMTLKEKQHADPKNSNNN